MKQFGSLMPILLLLGVGITSGLATAAELTASQQVLPQTAAVGETATVTLTLTYNGVNATQVMVVPSLPPGIMTDMPGAQTESLYPGSSVPISYPVRAVQSGSYLITSLISYTDERTTRSLSMMSEFTATGGSASSTLAEPTSSTPMPAVPDQSTPFDSQSQSQPPNPMPGTMTTPGQSGLPNQPSVPGQPGQSMPPNPIPHEGNGSMPS